MRFRSKLETAKPLYRYLKILKIRDLLICASSYNWKYLSEHFKKTRNQEEMIFKITRKTTTYGLNHSHKKQIVWKHGPNWPFYTFMLRTKQC